MCQHASFDARCILRTVGFCFQKASSSCSSSILSSISKGILKFLVVVLACLVLTAVTIADSYSSFQYKMKPKNKFIADVGISCKEILLYYNYGKGFGSDDELWVFQYASAPMLIGLFQICLLYN